MSKSNKTPNRFNCEVCDFISSKLSEYNRHIITKKHQIQTGQIQQNKKSATNKKPKIQHGGYYICDCGNKYKHYSSLWNHCRKCGAKNIDSINHSIDPINITNKDPILDNTNIRNTKDDIIEKLLSELQEERVEKTEMKSMFMLIMEQYQETVKGNQELVNKVIKIVNYMEKQNSSNM